MNLIKALFIVVGLGICSTAYADKAAENEAEKLMNIIGMEQAMDRSMTAMLNMQLQQNPALAPYKDIMMKFFQKHISYQSLKPDLKKIYSQNFTAMELKEINAFYATKAGQKAISKMPMLMAQGAQLGAQRVRDNIEELKTMINEEAKRRQQK